ncbi:MAG: hypothetical protein HS128_22070 [Ideonella sp.]|nr:hypothetical protein [Ideonella sp.]MCC7455690.1 hypothetical protein [Nitrospira sp.]
MKTFTPLHRAARACVAGALASALGACSGFDGEPGQAFDLATLPFAAPPSPLFDDEGRLQVPPPAALPDRQDLSGDAGRHVTRARAETIDQTLAGGVTWIDAGCCASVEEAAGLAVALVVAHDLDAGAPVFVTGANRQQAAAVADQLDQRGHTRVFVVGD